MKTNVHFVATALLCLLALQIGIAQSALDQYEKGLLAERQGSLLEAKSYYTKAINMEPGNGVFYLSRGNLVLNNQSHPKLVNPNNKLVSYKSCLKDFNNAVKLLPDSYEGFYGRAKVNYIVANFSKAKEDYSHAVKLAYYLEDKIHALVGRGASQYHMGELEGALRDLERAEAYDSTNAFVLNELALIYIQIDQPEIALRTLNKVLKRNPNDATANANIGYAALKAGEYEKALETYEKCLAEDGPNGFISSNIGFCKFKLNQLEEALASLEIALDLDPGNSYAYKNRALVYLQQNKIEQSCTDLREARELGYSQKYGSEVIQLLGEHCLEINKKPKKL